MSLDPRGPHRPIASLDSSGPTLPASGLPSSSRGLLVLRLSVGIVWALNLIFIVDPANQFFSSFEATANGFASQSIGGAALPDLVASHPAVFAPLIAAVTAYLAVAFLLGITVRWACGVGILLATGLLVSQFYGTFAIPGGTDVGPMPLYIAIYAALLWGRADRLGPLWPGGISRALGRRATTAGPSLSPTVVHTGPAERPKGSPSSSAGDHPVGVVTPWFGSR
jgi:hypothetical protein